MQNLQEENITEYWRGIEVWGIWQEFMWLRWRLSWFLGHTSEEVGPKKFFLSDLMKIIFSFTWSICKIDDILLLQKTQILPLFLIPPEEYYCPVGPLGLRQILGNGGEELRRIKTGLVWFSWQKSWERFLATRWEGKIAIDVSVARYWSEEI